jgi:multicomponent Na+:H+ antiporter subunit D
MATVFLAATATKVAVYLLLRYFFTVFGASVIFTDNPIPEILLILSLAAMFGASIVAVFQDDVKRMLAYSSVGQIGYITLGIAIANLTGLTGGIVHLFNHALMKAALFMAIGAVFYRIGSVKLDDLAGIGKRMPITMGAFVIAGFSIIGVPGTVGFVSKWYLVLGAFEQGWWWLAFLIVASSLISVVYIGRIVEVVWFRPVSAAAKRAEEPPLSMLLPTLLLVAATVYFGIDTSATAGIAGRAAEWLMVGIK